jgi:hypothetical protein
MEVTPVEVTTVRTGSLNVVLLFAPTIFLSAFLLFCCEPMVGKMMLPFLGGAAAVWITCLLFFQLMLLAGYGYAHALERYANVRTQIFVHAAMMLVAILFLPIQFSTRPDAATSSHPTLWLLGVLLKSVGIPFCIVSTTAPLLQNWLAKTRTVSGRDPYFLYAVSNAGSLLALLVYPVLIEPRFGVRIQSSYWFAGYLALLIFVACGSALVWTHLNEVTETNAAPETKTEAPSWRTRWYWLAAAFVPSGLMLAVTNHMLLNLASVPFLWVMPLALYLITFMIAFARRLHISSRILSAVVPVVLLVLFPLVAVSQPVAGHSLKYVLGSHMIVLFAGALLCHTALASRRPGTAYLTEFYFWVALGGALGGIFVAVIAPFVFSTVIEYPLLVALIAFFRDTRAPDQKINRGDWIYAAVLGLLIAGTWYLFKWATVDVTDDLKTSLGADAVLALIALLAYRRRVRFALALVVLIAGYHLALPGFLDDYQILHIDRDFFGIKKVVFDANGNMRRLLHGDTLHGLESMDSTLIGKPLSYYHETGPVGDIMRLISTRPNQHVGVVGLGTGTMAGWALPDRRITFFDIDPQVYDIAHNFFTFLRRCATNCTVVIGDGRLSIEKQPETEFDVLMLDAFNSDSIPAHLVSREAVQMYLKKLKPDGLILFHVSNRYMDVESLVSAVLLDAGLQGLVRYDDDEEPTGKASSDYVVAARSVGDFGALEDDENWSTVEKPATIQPWTDDYSNMMAIVRWK